MTKDVYYFSHDCNARNDPKILALRSVYGMEGYGIYFALVEIMRESPDYKIHITNYTWNALALQLQCTGEFLEQFVADCISEFTDGEEGLFATDDESFWAESLLRRMSEMESKREKCRAAAKSKRTLSEESSDADRSDSETKANAEQTLSERSTDAEQTHDKYKNKNKKENISPNGDITPHTPLAGRRDTQEERFADFWAAYPRKSGKGAAQKAWAKLKPSKELFETIMTQVAFAKQCEQWQKDGGQYIPNPATWLNQRRWEDEYELCNNRRQSGGSPPRGAYKPSTADVMGALAGIYYEAKEEEGHDQSGSSGDDGYVSTTLSESGGV